MIYELEDDGRLVLAGLEHGSLVDGDELVVRPGFADPDVAAGVRELLGVGVHGQLELAAAPVGGVRGLLLGNETLLHQPLREFGGVLNQ